MIEFSQTITEAQREFLTANKAELTKTEGGSRLWQNRVKMAGEAYAIAKAAYTDVDFDGVPQDSEERVSGLTQGFPDWPTYRDGFILDWIANRTVVTDEEADMIFDRDAEAALAVIDGEDPVLVEEDEVSIVGSEAVSKALEAGVPPCVAAEIGNAAMFEAANKPVEQKRRGRPPKTPQSGLQRAFAAAKATREKPKAAAKKKAGSAAAKAAEIISRYQERDWSRKEILEKLCAQLAMGPAYASTLYQKFAR